MTAKLEGCCVLVVDDNHDTRILLTTLLEFEGAIVVTVDSAMAALTALEQFQPDLLLCDLAMPNIDGYALLRQLRNSLRPQWTQLPAIAMTAMCGAYDQYRSIEMGFQVHLEKPLDLDRLIQAIQTLVPLNARFCKIPFVDTWVKQSQLLEDELTARSTNCSLPLSA